MIQKITPAGHNATHPPFIKDDKILLHKDERENEASQRNSYLLGIITERCRLGFFSLHKFELDLQVLIQFCNAQVLSKIKALKTIQRITNERKKIPLLPIFRIMCPRDLSGKLASSYENGCFKEEKKCQCLFVCLLFAIYYPCTSSTCFKWSLKQVLLI